MHGNAKEEEEEEEEGADLDDHLIDYLVEDAKGVADAKEALQGANAAFDNVEIVVEDVVVAVEDAMETAGDASWRHLQTKARFVQIAYSENDLRLNVAQTR